MSRYPSKSGSPSTLGAEARLLGDRDEVPQMPQMSQFDVHRERNPNRHTITATVDTIAPREA